MTRILFTIGEVDGLGDNPLRHASIEMQAFAEEFSPRTDLDDDEEKIGEEQGVPLLDRTYRRRSAKPKKRDLKRLMLDGIPSNWAELLAYVVLMCLCHLILRLAIVRSGLPSDQNVFKPADQFNNYLCESIFHHFLFVFSTTFF